MTFENVYMEVSRLFNDRPMLTWFENGEKKSFDSDGFYRMTDKTAKILEKKFMNIPKGSWIGLKCRNSPLWYPVFFGLLKIGYPVLLLDSAIDDMALASFAEQSAMKGIVSDKPENLDSVICCETSEIDLSESGTPDSVSWEHRIAFCTSGTTGQAKIYVFYADAVMEQSVNIRKVYNENKIIAATGAGDEKADYPVLQSLPQRHCLGFGLTILMWSWGYPMMMPEMDGIFSVADTCRKYGIWGLCTVPAIWKGLFRMAQARFGKCDSEAMHKLLGDKIGLAVSAGARLDESLAQKALQSGIDFWNGWGMTETSFVTVGDIAEDDSVDYVGVLVNKHTTEITDSGELTVNGSTLYNSTLVNGVEIPRDVNSYYHTGDIFTVKDGHYYFKGRCKSVIIREDGENIYIDELESHFRFLDECAEHFCIFELNESPALVIFSHNGINETVTEKIKQINYSLPQPKRIMKAYVSSQPLPMTSKGEVSRYYMVAYIGENNAGMEELSLRR